MTMIGTTLDKLGRFPPEPAITLPEKGWRRIEATLGIEKPNPGFRRGVATTVMIYLAWPEPQLARVRPRHLRKSINKILKDARQLRADLVFEDDEEDQDDLQEWARVLVNNSIGYRDHETLLASLEQVVKTLEGIMASLPSSRGGRPRNVTLYGLTHHLADEYFHATGEIPTMTHDPFQDDEPYRGQFFDFVRTVLEVFAPQYDSGNLALGKSIQRTLRDWRTRTVMDKT